MIECRGPAKSGRERDSLGLSLSDIGELCYRRQIPHLHPRFLGLLHKIQGTQCLSI